MKTRLELCKEGSARKQYVRIYERSYVHSQRAHYRSASS